jgi:ketose-bisphosphate aldolase
MPLVNGKRLLMHAYEHGYAVPAFNANTMEQTLAIAAAAEAEQAPVFIQLSQGTIEHLGLEPGAEMIRLVTEHTTVPVVMHLDHGKDLAQNARALRAGCTSLMFDGSALPYEENVARTLQVVTVAHACGIPVEAELGRVPRSYEGLSPEQVAQLATDPEQAADFVAHTGCDSLAVAVGSVHGVRSQSATLDLERLEAIHRRVNVPLVSHGSSGTRDESLVEAIRLGMAKINVFTRFNIVFTDHLRRSLQSLPDEYDPRHHLKAARDAQAEAMRRLIALFGASGRARDLL